MECLLLIASLPGEDVGRGGDEGADGVGDVAHAEGAARGRGRSAVGGEASVQQKSH